MKPLIFADKRGFAWYTPSRPKRALIVLANQALTPYSRPCKPRRINQMKTRIFVIASVVCICALIAMGQSKKRPSPTPTPASTWDSYEGVKWQKGNSVGALGDIAQVKVPEGFVFAGANDTRLIMEANQNPTNGRELGFVAPANENWFAVFEFDDVGYVKDDDKDSLD